MKKKKRAQNISLRSQNGRSRKCCTVSFYTVLSYTDMAPSIPTNAGQPCTTLSTDQRMAMQIAGRASVVSVIAVVR